ncbi:MAG: PIN domain-containing protein [Terriglobales bacterium]|jgi:predicted nucleic acid-binding protein
MNPRRGLVLDANILMRAVLGRRVRELLERYEDSATFYSPDVCFDDARQYLWQVLEKRGLEPESGLTVLEQISQLVLPVDGSLYADYERLARERIETRDPDDWPVVAVALMLDLPIWTEDQDLFGSGVATWTTDRVEVYLKAGQGP